MVAAALRQEIALASSAIGPTRDEVLARYHDLREISKRLHSEAMSFLSRDAILHHARQLGLALGNTLVLDSMDELTLAFDLAIHTAPVGRSRAIDRYARSARFAAGSDEALVLDAMCRARFSIVCVERQHESAGMIVKDVLRRSDLWLVDAGLENSLPDGSVIATRLFTPERFAMTAGVVVPFDLELMEDVLCEVPQLTRKTLVAVSDDRRFAETTYRLAIADGLTEQISYVDPQR
jgi:hypothetical protein